MPLGPLEAVLARVALRVRVQRALRAGAVYGVAGGAVATLAAATHALGALGAGDLRDALLGALALPLAGAALGAARPVPRLERALLVDRAHRLGGRVASAVELERVRTPMARAAVRDAMERGRGLSAKRAMPVTAPRALVPALALAALAAALFAVERPRAEAPAARPPPRALSALVLPDDDLDAHREALTRLRPRPDRPDAVRREVERASALLEALSDRRIEREAALRELGEIARGLREARPSAIEGIEDALERLERPLETVPRTEALARALGARDLALAAEEMDAVAEGLRTDPPSAAELRRLRDALERAAAELDGEALAREREALEEREERLLRRREEERALSGEERARRDEERERELERLRRDVEEHREAEEALERLRRALEEMAAESRGSGREPAPEREGEAEESAAERAARDLHRFGEDEMTSEELTALERQIEALRELVRRTRDAGGEGDGGESERDGEREGEGGGDGESAAERMRRFVLRARGAGDEDDGEGVPLAAPGGSGGGGEGASPGGAGEGGEGEREASAEGAGGEGAGGEAPEGAGGEMLVLGEGEDRLVLPGMGTPGAGTGPGEERPGSGAGEPSGEEGDGAGEGSDLRRSAEAAGRGGEHTTVRVTGEAGRGPTRSEVIRTAAARGFAAREYGRVYGEYLEHAEEVIEDEAIPPGYRFYVRRYFQLIRPREAAE